MKDACVFQVLKDKHMLDFWTGIDKNKTLGNENGDKRYRQKQDIK